MSSNEVRPTGRLVRVARHPLSVLLGSFLALGVLALALALTVQPLLEQLGFGDAAGHVVTAGASTLVLLGVSRWIERRTPSEVGLAREHALRDTALGALAGLLLISLVVGLIALAGGYSAVWDPAPPPALLGALLTFLIAAWFEEVFFRAILFRHLEGWAGSGVALLVSSLVFGAAHLGNPDSGWLPALAIALEAGVMLGAVWMWTRSLWAVWGIHFAWNWTQGGLFGAPVSGTRFSGLLHGTLSGDPLWTGGAFGPEAGLTAVLVCGTAGALALAHVVRKGGWRPCPWKGWRGRSGAAPAAS